VISVSFVRLSIIVLHVCTVWLGGEFWLKPECIMFPLIFEVEILNCKTKKLTFKLIVIITSQI